MMTPEKFFKLLRAFTEDAYEYLKVPTKGNSKNNYGKYKEGEPSGHVMHYTGSPDSKSRLTNVMNRFRLNSPARVGVAFAIFDKMHPRLKGVRAKYPELYGPDGVLEVDVLFWGLDLAFYTSNWACKFTAGTELRNAGKIKQEDDGSFTWGGKPWKGRKPVNVRGMWAEPFTDRQILASVLVCRQLKKWQETHAHFDPMHFMSHHLIHPNKWDCWPQYPFNRVKRAICNGTKFVLTDYLQELNEICCSPITDDSTAEEFLRAMGYLVLPAGCTPDTDKRYKAMKKYLDKDVPQAIKFFQEKKGLKKTGTLTQKTIKAMNATRRAYKLHVAGC